MGSSSVPNELSGGEGSADLLCMKGRATGVGERMTKQ